MGGGVLLKLSDVFTEVCDLSIFEDFSELSLDRFEWGKIGLNKRNLSHEFWSRHVDFLSGRDASAASLPYESTGVGGSEGRVRIAAIRMKLEQWGPGKGWIGDSGSY